MFNGNFCCVVEFDVPSTTGGEAVAVAVITIPNYFHYVQLSRDHLVHKMIQEVSHVCDLFGEAHSKIPDIMVGSCFGAQQFQFTLTC